MLRPDQRSKLEELPGIGKKSEKDFPLVQKGNKRGRRNPSGIFSLCV
jgi:hypothetical protein